MVNNKIVVKNKSGLHLRPAGILSKVASQCQSEIRFIKEDGTKVNPKSVLFLMSAGITCGTEITIECDGISEVEDLKVIIDAIESGLGE